MCFVFARAIAKTTNDGEATLRHEVDDRDVFSDAQRIVQRHEKRRNRNGNVLGTAENRCSHCERGGTPSVLGAVMLFERHHAATKFVKNLSHVEHGVVTIGHLVWIESRLNAIETHHG